jgi:hypothetical protein
MINQMWPATGTPLPLSKEKPALIAIRGLLTNCLRVFLTLSMSVLKRRVFRAVTVIRTCGSLLAKIYPGGSAISLNHNKTE